MSARNLEQKSKKQLPVACWPHKVHAVESIPQNNIGKIDREKLKQMLTERIS
jgi:non-ribosomal peptide synthetase component E (peptide arylation enzyme)